MSELTKEQDEALASAQPKKLSILELAVEKIESLTMEELAQLGRPFTVNQVEFKHLDNGRFVYRLYGKRMSPHKADGVRQLWRKGQNLEGEAKEKQQAELNIAYADALERTLVLSKKTVAKNATQRLVESIKDAMAEKNGAVPRPRKGV